MSRRTSPGTLLFIALAALVFVSALLFRQGLSSLLWRVLAPIAALRNSLEGGEASQLRAALASSTAALADRATLAAENKELRAQLGRRAEGRVVLAGVLQHPPGTPYDTLVVDAGAAEGVVLGARVSAGTLTIGTVDTVNAHTSRVVLYSAPGQSYQAMIATRAGATPAAIEGQGGGSMRARVPSGSSVRAGDTVAFPGLGGGIAGEVFAVSGGEGDTFKTVYVRLPVNLFELERVYIHL